MVKQSTHNRLSLGSIPSEPTKYKHMKTYTAEILDAEDGSGDGILQLPEDFCKEDDWREGDRIHMEVVGETLVMKNLDRNKREGIFEQIPLPLD